MSCQEDGFPNQAVKIEFTESLEQWNKLNETNGRSYKYTTTFTSWKGYGATTEIIVMNDEVIGRNYESFQIDNLTGNKEVLESFQEAESELNTNSYGAPTSTIDELYDSCIKNYLVVSERNNTIYFETNDDDLMILCGYVPNNCADDCFSGIRISSFEWLDI